ncbi:MAG: hypothetical protein WBZ48_13685 [Bacteroidota bacterium]
MTPELQIEYVPGVCNIGPDEIARRRNLGWVALAITLVLMFTLAWTGVNSWWRLFVFFPAMTSASGFLQVHFHFCSGFARVGVFNFGSIGETNKVTDEISRAKDKRRGGQITLYAALVGGAITLFAVLLN